MAFRITRYETTPNPNALKCWLDGPISDRPRSFLNAGMAEDDPLAAALFRVPGVTVLLFNDNWLTVNKDPDADWKAIKSAVEKVLARSEREE